MYRMYLDDERNPIEKYDIICRTPDAAIKAFRKRYKAGGRHFFLEMDYDSSLPDTFDKVLKKEGTTLIDMVTYINDKTLGLPFYGVGKSLTK